MTVPVIKRGHYLYRITAPDGRAYIGITGHAPSRWDQHALASTSPIGKAIREFGRANMKFEVLAIGRHAYLIELERSAIEKFNTLVPNGFNRSPGSKTKMTKAAFDDLRVHTMNMRVSVTTKEMIEAIANAENRSIANTIELMIAAEFKKRGLQKPIDYAGIEARRRAKLARHAPLMRRLEAVA